MPSLFRVVDCRSTNLDALILRWRWETQPEVFIHEIKLGEEFVLTSAVAAVGNLA